MAKRYGPQPLSWQIEKLTKPIFRKRGFGEAAILTDWETVVGPLWASHSCPEKLIRSRDEARGATLHLRVDSGAFATELTHSEPQLLQRINGFYGYRAVERIKVIQGPLPPKKHCLPSRDDALSAEDEDTLSTRLARVEDPDLRAALEGLGRGVAGKNSAKKE